MAFDPNAAMGDLRAAMTRMMTIVADDRSRPDPAQPTPHEVLAFIDAAEEAVEAWAKLELAGAIDDVADLVALSYGGQA